MAEKFRPKIFDINSINGGNRYQNGQGIDAESINSAIEASAYAQALATNQPDISNANNVGTPSVSIQLTPNGTPQLKFENLKSAEVVQTFGESEEAVMSQKAVTKELDKKANVSDMTLQLNAKADTTYVDELTAVLTQDKVNSLF